MKKTLAIILSVALVFSIMAIPTFAADESSSASTDQAPAAPAPAAPAAPKASSSSSSGSSSSSSSAATGATYTVKSGDVFWKIAQLHNLTVAELASLNPQIKNINLIFPGQKINVKAAAVPAVSAKKLYHGSAIVPNYRVSKTNLNVTTASVLFDQDGKIVQLQWDVLEITPSLFPGWHDPNGTEADLAMYYAAESGWNWETKKEEGDAYNMKRAAISGKEWWEQMDFYEKFFVGKTVAEVKAWASKYTNESYKPYKLAYLDNPNITEADKAAAEAVKATLTADEIKMLVDVSTNATMSLQDNHSRFLDALEKAWEYRKEVK